MAFWNKKKEANITAEDSLCTMKVAVAGTEDANKRTLTDLSSQGISAYGVSTSNPVEEEEEDVKPVEEEYIWVDGYKALYPSMKASYGDITYEVGKEFALPDGEDPQVCNRGFHFCLNHIYLKQYVSYGRVFKVRAEVKKSDYDKFGEDGTYTYEKKYHSEYYFPGYRPNYSQITVDKIAARKIILTEEITDFDFIKETFNMPIYVKTQEDYEDFLHYVDSGFSTTHWYLKKFCEAMETYGYAEPFCTIVFRQLGDYAYKCKHISDFAAGLDLMNLSMDMKVYLVLEETKKIA